MYLFHEILFNYALTVISRHALQLYLSLNGNFRLQKKKKNNDPDDVTLMKGLTGFPPESPFQDYLLRVGESKEVSCKFPVLNMLLIFVFVLCKEMHLRALKCCKHAG